MVFTGTYDHTIDPKNRLAIPSEVRAQIRRSMSRHGDGGGKGDPIVLYVTLGRDSGLCLYTEQGYEKRADELDQSEMDAEELLEYERLFYALSKPVELDKQGRVTLPGDLLSLSGLGTEVVLIGVKDHMEVRDRKSWYEHLDRMLKERRDMLMNPRLAMRRRGRQG
ncbi:MAG: division/cell wall cluster transcriptional repressor MraZ [Phycisphaeraceae bacterium]